MSQQPSLAAMCEVYLAEIDNGRRGGFPVETLAIPHVIRAKMESLDLPVAIDDLPFDRVVEMVEQFQRDEKVAAMKARRAKKNSQFAINTPKKGIEKSPVKKTKGVAESKKIVEKPPTERSVVPKIVEKSKSAMDSVEHDVEMMEELVVEPVVKIAVKQKEKPPVEEQPTEASVVPKVGKLAEKTCQKLTNKPDLMEHNVEMTEELVVEPVVIAEKQKEKPPSRKSKGIVESKKIAETSVVPKIVEKSQNVIDLVDDDVEMTEELVVEPVQKTAVKQKEKPPVEEPNVKPTAEPNETVDAVDGKVEKAKGLVAKSAKKTAPFVKESAPEVQMEPVVKTTEKNVEQPEKTKSLAQEVVSKQPPLKKMKTLEAEEQVAELVDAVKVKEKLKEKNSELAVKSVEKHDQRSKEKSEEPIVEQPPVEEEEEVVSFLMIMKSILEKSKPSPEVSEKSIKDADKNLEKEGVKELEQQDVVVVDLTIDSDPEEEQIDKEPQVPVITLDGQDEKEKRETRGQATGQESEWSWQLRMLESVKTTDIITIADSDEETGEDADIASIMASLGYARDT